MPCCYKYGDPTQLCIIIVLRFKTIRPNPITYKLVGYFGCNFVFKFSTIMSKMHRLINDEVLATFGSKAVVGFVDGRIGKHVVVWR